MNKYKDNPKILIGTITSDQKDYCLEDFLRQYKKLTYPNIDIIVADNSKKKSHARILKKYGIKVLYRPKRYNETFWEAMLRCENAIRDYFLSRDYDYLFKLESDVFIPYNSIELLLSADRSVIGISYFLGQSYYSYLLEQEWCPLYDIDRYFLKMQSNMKSFLNFDGNLKPANQKGFGALLIKRWVIEKIPFRLDQNKTEYCDTWFYNDLHQRNIGVYTIDLFVASHRNVKFWNNNK